jgi:hypothetical protein
MDTKLMTLRCDHCRNALRADIHHYWRMRFCSASCKQAYQRRLQDNTRLKIRRLVAVARPAMNARSKASQTAVNLAQRLAG